MFSILKMVFLECGCLVLCMNVRYFFNVIVKMWYFVEMVVKLCDIVIKKYKLDSVGYVIIWVNIIKVSGMLINLVKKLYFVRLIRR